MCQRVICNSRGGTSARDLDWCLRKLIWQCEQRVWSLASKKLGWGGALSRRDSGLVSPGTWGPGAWSLFGEWRKRRTNEFCSSWNTRGILTPPPHTHRGVLDKIKRRAFIHPHAVHAGFSRIPSSFDDWLCLIAFWWSLFWEHVTQLTGFTVAELNGNSVLLRLGNSRVKPH